MEIELARLVRFESAHRYYNEAWSREQNFAVFGACANDNGHGHSYALEAFFKGPIEEETGMIVNLKDVDDLLQNVTRHFDQKNLNQLPEFKNKIPTTEVLANEISKKILAAAELPKNVQLSRLKLYESENLWVELKL